MKSTYYYIVLLGFILIGITSCKSKKQIVNTTSPVEIKANSELFSDILANTMPFSTFSSKLNLSVVTGTRSMSSKASLKIVKDQMLQVSIQPLFGVEVFRFHVDKDTMVVLDRMNKRYVKESLADLKKRYPVGFDFSTLQALFTNSLFVSGHAPVIASDYTKFTYSETANSYYLKATDKVSGIECAFTVNADDKIIFSHLMGAESSYSLQWAYADFALMDNRQFPYKMDVTAGSANKKIEVGMEFSSITLNEPMELYINIPSSYTRVLMDDIIKIITAGDS